jgi:hydrogenase-4 component B
MEDLGGLIKSMPYTALFFLIGAISISALPPFNGFASEWLVFQSLFSSVAISGLALKIFFAIIIAILALTSALAAACFVKAFGITFLALPRSKHAEQAKEAGWPIKFGMGFLAILCFLFGIYPFPIINLLNTISSELLSNPTIPNLANSGTLFITPFENGFSSFSPVWIMLLTFAIILIAFALERIFGGKATKRIYGTWDCGSHLNPRMQYTATAFSKPIQMIFKNIYRSNEKVETNYYDQGTKYFMKGMKYEVELNEIYAKYLYTPLARIIITVSEKMRRVQYGNVHIYLLYIFITLIVLLLFFK